MFVRIVCFAIFVAIASVAFAQDAEPKITYDDHVRPILREHCFTCHHQGEKKGGLALDNYGATMSGGASGEVVLGGDVDSSRLYALVSHAEQPFMPPNQDKIADEKLAVLKKWIETGALENSGSKAAIKKKKSMAMTSAPTTGRPSGPPPMPENLIRQPLYVPARTGAVTALATSPWAPLAAVASPKQIVLYNTDTAECVGVLPYPEGSAYVLKFSRNGSLLLAGGGRGGHSGSVVLFDVKSGERVAKIGDELDVVLAADINDTQTMVAMAGPQRVVRIYSTETGEKLFEIKKHTDWVYAVEFSPDGVLLATTDRSGGMFVWESATAREYLALRGHNGAVCDVAWRPDSNVLATIGEDTTIKLWEMNDGNQIKNWGAHGGGGFNVDFTHDGRLVSAGRDRTVKTWNGEGAALKAFGMPDDALRCAFTHDGQRVLGGDWQGNLKLWDHETGAEAGAVSPNPPRLEQQADALRAQVAAAAGPRDAAAAELAAAEKTVADATAALAKANDAAPVFDATAKQEEQKRIAAEAEVVKAKEALALANKTLEEAQAKLKTATDANDESAKTLAQTAVIDGEKLATEVQAKVAAADKALIDATVAAKAAADAYAANMAEIANQTKAKTDGEAVVAAKRPIAEQTQAAVDTVSQRLANVTANVEAFAARAQKLTADLDAAKQKLALADQALAAATTSGATEAIAAAQAARDAVAEELEKAEAARQAFLAAYGA